MITAVLLIGGWSTALWYLRVMVLHLQPRMRLGLSIGAWVVTALVFYLALSFLSWWSAPQEDTQRLDYGYQLGYEVHLALAVIGALVVMIRCWGEPALAHIGLPRIRGQKQRILTDVGFGLMLGPSAVGAVLVAGLLGGWFQFGGVVPLTAILSSLLQGAGLFALVAVVEEVTTRGGLVAGLSRVIGWQRALIVSTLTFVTLHVDNPGASPLALIGIGMAGLVLSLALLRTGALWLPIAFHASWDWAQTSLYGFRDSGLPSAGVLHLLVDQNAPRWLTGGEFGPEASVPVLLVLAGVAVAIVLYSRGRNPEKGLLKSAAEIESSTSYVET